MSSPPDSDSLGSSLLAWVRSFDNAGQIEGLAELNDGQVLWSILQDVDPNYFAGALPEPDINSSSEWTRKWQNLKHVEKQLSIYFRDVCNRDDSVAAGPTGPDLQAIAADASIPGLETLIMEIIRVAMASPLSNERMAKRLMGLGTDYAMAIAYKIKSMDDTSFTDSEPASRDEPAYPPEAEPLPEPSLSTGPIEKGGLFGDPLLEREEELLLAQATIEKLQASHDTVQQQLHELRQEKERLQDAFDSYRSEINNKGRKVVGDDALKKLQRQADNDRAYIDDLEGQLQSSRNAVENYERQIQKFKDETETNQKLRDDLQMLRAENEDLTQKLKANENLKKKIQALQEQDKANASLREDLKQANERLEDLDRMKAVQASLEKEIIEKKGLIRNQEYQINELSTMRKHAEYDARVLAQKLEAARERQERDHDMIEEMRAKLQETNADDDIEIDIAPEAKTEPSETDVPRKAPAASSENTKHFTDKIALLEKQLEAADIRLKQASQRNAVLEEQTRGRDDSSAAATQKTQQQVEEQDHVIADLRRKLEVANKAAREATPQDITSLQRENRLMVSAWYDLSNRLQSNNVSLGRHRQDPKSWIGKQRALVGPYSNLK